MPRETIAPGFFGKIPRSGDFVSRRLSADFVAIWDKFIAAHIVSHLRNAAVWPENGLRFLLGHGPKDCAPHIGLIVPSHDTVGRLFPLTIASPIVVAETPTKIAAWFAEITGPALDAAEGIIDSGELDLALENIGLAQLNALPKVPFQLIVPGRSPLTADFEDPAPALAQIFASKVGAL